MEDTEWLFQQINYFQSQHPEELAWKASRLKTSKRKIERLRWVLLPFLNHGLHLSRGLWLLLQALCSRLENGKSYN